MSALRNLYDRYSGHDPLLVGDDLMGILGQDIAPLAKNQRLALRNVRLSKVDHTEFLKAQAESRMAEARKEQTVLSRNVKRSKEVAAEKMRLKQRRYKPTKLEVRTGTLPFRTEPLVGTIKSSDGSKFSEALDFYSSIDAESVTVEGDDARIGLHILIHIFYQASVIQHVIAFSGFGESTVEVIRGITKMAYTGDLGTFNFRNPQVVFSTCRCHFPASVSQVPLEQGVNFITEMACPANLQQIASGAPDHFDLFGPVGDLDLTRPPFKLLSYPIFNVHIGTTAIFKRAFFGIETLELPLAEGGRGWDMRVCLAGFLDEFGGTYKVLSDVVGDTDPLVFHLALGQPNPILFDLTGLAPLFSNNGDYLEALPGSTVIEGGLVKLISGFEVREAQWVYDLFTHQLTSLAVSISVLHTITIYHPAGAELLLSDIAITWLVGFPESGIGRPITLSAEATLTNKLLGQAPVSIALGPNRFAMTGAVAEMPESAFGTLVGSLGLTRRESIPDDFGRVTEVVFCFDLGIGVQVWIQNESGDTVEWSRKV